MKHIWSVLCKKSIIDSETNSISLNEVLEEVTFFIDNKELLNKPVNFPFDFEMVSYFIASKKSEKADMEIELFDPNNKKLGVFNQKIEFTDAKMRLRIRIKMPAIGVENNGEYWFKIKTRVANEEKFKTVAEIPLQIKKEFATNLN